LMEDFGGVKLKIGEALVKDQVGDEAFHMLKEFKQLSEQKGIQTKMPFTLNIK